MGQTGEHGERDPVSGLIDSATNWSTPIDRMSTVWGSVVFPHLQDKII